MGVGGNFWDFLKPYARFEGFDFLRNKRVAVDLSYWIVQQETAIKGNHRNSHIRQTFFRTVNLFVKFGAYPVFVLDGTPSPLKNQTRILRFFRSSGIDLSRLREAKECISVERNRAFTKCIEECVVLLELLGMPVLKAKAEAEALCAELNREGHVDACITADSDAFLYGARCVIKRIQPKSKEPFECYHISDIETVLELKRNHLIAVSLLVGNDHDLNGVKGIGLETAVRFVKSFKEDEIFDWLHKLAKGDPLLVQETMGGGKDAICFSDDKSTRKSPHCSHCGHPGKKKAHLMFSCGYCNSNAGQSCLQKPVGFKCSCSSCNRDQVEKLNRKNKTWRSSVCQKIASVQNFPNDEILQMYLRKNHGTDDGQYIEWAPPCPDMLVDFLAYQQQWKPSYIRQRLLPMLSTIYLRDMASSPRADLLCGQYEFNSIQRVKTTYGHNVFIVSWKKATTVYLSTEESDLNQEPAKHDECPEELDAPYVYRERGCCFLLTEEDMELVRRAFPAKASQFLQEREVKETKSSKCKSNFGSEGTPVISRSSGCQSVQPRITEFYHSTKMLPQNKFVDNAENSGDSSQGKRKSSSSRIPKSVRRRLLFGRIQNNALKTSQRTLLCGMYDKDILSVWECSPSMANKGVCILFLKDDPLCNAIVDVMLQHRTHEVLAFGNISCVQYAIGMAKDLVGHNKCS